MKKFKKGSIIVATNPTQGRDTRTYKVLRNCKNGLVVESCYYGNTLLFTHQRIKDDRFVDVRNIPVTCKKVWKAFVQTVPTITGDGTYMAKNSGYIYVLYMTKYHMFCVSPNGHFVILDSLWSIDMFKECKAPKIDYYAYARKLRAGQIATTC